VSSHHLALVGDERTVAGIKDHLDPKVGAPCLVYQFDSVQQELTPDRVWVLVCVAAAPGDGAQITRLVREAHLRQLPVGLILLETEAFAAGNSLQALEPYVIARLEWPRQAPALAELVRREARQRSAVPTRGAEPEDGVLQDVLSRHLRSQTPSLTRLAEPLALAAAHDVTALIIGETGTGKTHLAQLIHQHSPRRHHRLMVVPCGALSPALIESELFGHVKGAFTGADRVKVGKFEAVGEGTLLLDEIDALGLEQQAKLLRVIQTGAYEPVGGNDTQYCRGRIIAASNWNLEEAVAQGKFRPDLYYRLNVLGFHLPPLRERAQDVRPLARAMIARFSAKFNKPLFAVSPEALACLEAFPWPGNIRQLENVIQQAVLVSKGPELLKQHLPQLVREHAPAAPVQVNVPENLGSLAESRNVHERNTIVQALQEAKQCRSHAAHALGISRVTLYNKMKKYGITKSLA
jgi:two-component system, NtrC family, response regulator HydG